MNSKTNRLAKKRDFDLLFKYGRWVNGQALDLRYLELAKNKDYVPQKENVDKFVSQLRLAYSVGLKLSKKSVDRNRIKRRLREVVRLLEKEKAFKGGFYLLLVPKKNFVDKSLAEISQETKLLLQKINII
jgi:ribonuclease P protein component